ncbi:MAG: hypothetical protein ACD_5C00016G0013 [uncultured bacterium]|nr:MAG: hypothetical protein ACD_5C00016G0013 [uncultured bacterium]
MQPFTNVDYLPLPAPGQVSSYASQLSGNFQAIQIGAGAKSYKADRTGIWMGANTFAEAPFSVDMQGNIWANSIVIAGLSGSVIASSIDANGNFVKQLISSSLDTQSKLILGEFTFSGSGALAIKTDASNGLWISPTGILAKKAGATTFAIDSAGNATFSGTISAATMNGGSINGGTITGAYIQTAATGARVILSGTQILFYVDGDYKGSIAPDTANSMLYSSASNHLFFGAGGAGLATLNTDGLTMHGGRSLYLQGGQKIKFSDGPEIVDVGYALQFNTDLIPSSDEGRNCGTAARKWNEVRADKFWQSSNTNGSRQVHDFAYIEMGLLDPAFLKKIQKKNKGMQMANGYMEGLVLPFKKGTVLKWGNKGLMASIQKSDFAVAIADEHGLPIVLGAEPVRVIGRAKIGDAIVPSDVKGLACAIGIGEVMPGQSVIGRCLVNKTSSRESLTMVMIKF